MRQKDYDDKQRDADKMNCIWLCGHADVAIAGMADHQNHKA